MMKHILKTKKLFLLWLVSGIVSCSTPNQALLDKVDEKIAGIENIIDLNNISISPATAPESEIDSSMGGIGTFKEGYSYDPSFFDSLTIKATNSYPNSYYRIDYNLYDLSTMLGKDNFYFGDNPERQPRFVTEEIIYADGSSEPAASALLTIEDIKKLPNFEEEEKQQFINNTLTPYFFQNNSRPVKAIRVKVITNFPKAKEYPVKAGQETVKTDKGDIKILTCKGNEITYKAPAALADKIEVNALYKNGKHLVSKGSQTLKSTHEITQLNDMLERLKQARQQITDHKINTENELDQFLQSAIKEKTNPADEWVVRSEYFSAPFSSIIFAVADTSKPSEALHTYYINDQLASRYQETGYAVCEDAKTGKTGVIGFDGKWIINPDYSFLRQTNYIKNYVEGARNEGESINTLFWIDQQNHRLVKTNYDLNSYSLQRDHQRLLIVQEADSGPDTKLGVADKETGQLVIPLRYAAITFSKGTILCSSRNKNIIEIFDENGKLIGTKPEE